MPEPFITQAPLTVDAWLHAFEGRDLPVLRTTAVALEEWRANEDAVDAHLLAQTIAVDPLMTLKLLRHVAKLRAGRGQTDAETVTEALVMLGITPFFKAFAPGQAVLEDLLPDQPEAQAGLHRVMTRAQRAARLAWGFALHRQDHDAGLIHQAALLHDFAEMLLWVHAPRLALGVQQLQAAHPTMRSAEAQLQLLHIPLAELQQALMKAWRLPALLVLISDDAPSPLHQVRNVQLAIQIARHSALGWDNPALPDDITALGQLLCLSGEHALALIHDLDAPDSTDSADSNDDADDAVAPAGAAP